MIHLILPAMRDSVKDVLEDLNNQTYRMSRVVVTLIDNSDGGLLSIFRDFKSKYHLNYLHFNKNIGTNEAWNMMWKSDHEYVGVIGDDYRLDLRCLEALMCIMGNSYIQQGYEKNIKAVTARIQQTYKDNPTKAYPLPKYPTDIYYPANSVRAKGRLGLAIFDKEVIKKIPRIPEEFKIFFGDNWIEYWLECIDEKLVQPSEVSILHSHKKDLSEKLDYKKVIEKERELWKGWIRGEKVLHIGEKSVHIGDAKCQEK